MDFISWYENCLGINEFAGLNRRQKSIVRDYDSALKKYNGMIAR